MTRKVILSKFFFLLVCINLSGQWYVKRYNVQEIELLSREQLNEALKDSKKELLYSGIISVTGVGVFLAGRYLRYEITDESSIIEQLLGEKGMKKVLMVTGAGVTVGGAVAVVVYLGRIGRIKSVINEYYSWIKPFGLKPAIIVNADIHTFNPGITLTYNF